MWRTRPLALHPHEPEVATRRAERVIALVEQLKNRGVKFEICEITLRGRKLTKDQFIADATYVPSGVAEITRLQQREGYAYLKP